MRIARALSVGVILSAVLLAPVSASAQTPTFAKDVAPIFYSKCVECHRPTMFAPMSLVKYDEARPWAQVDQEPRLRTHHAAMGRRSPARRLQERSASHRQGDLDHPRVGRRRRAEGRRQGHAGGAVVHRWLDHRRAGCRVRDERDVPDSRDRRDRISIHSHPDEHPRGQVARGDRDQAAGARARPSRARLHAAGRHADQ